LNLMGNYRSSQFESREMHRKGCLCVKSRDWIETKSQTEKEKQI
jgi:hypothetical protein